MRDDREEVPCFRHTLKRVVESKILSILLVEKGEEAASTLRNRRGFDRAEESMLKRDLEGDERAHEVVLSRPLKRKNDPFFVFLESCYFGLQSAQMTVHPNIWGRMPACTLSDQYMV